MSEKIIPAARPQAQEIHTQISNPLGYLVKSTLFPVISEIFYQYTGLTSMPYVHHAFTPISSFEERSTIWLKSWGAEAKKSGKKNSDSSSQEKTESSTSSGKNKEPETTTSTTTQGTEGASASTGSTGASGETSSASSGKTETVAANWFPTFNCGCCSEVGSYFLANQARFTTAAALGLTNAFLSRMIAENSPKMGDKKRAFYSATATLALISAGSYFAGSSLNTFEIADMSWRIIVSKNTWERAARPALQTGAIKSQDVYSWCANKFEGSLKYLKWDLAYQVKRYKND